MKIYSITYDLHKPGQNYENLYNEIKKNNWWHHLESTWLIYTSETADQIYNRLIKHLDKNDFILINEFGRDYQGWLPQKAWDWIKEKLRLVA